MDEVSIQQCNAHKAPPTKLVPSFAILNVALAVAIFIAASYFMEQAILLTAAELFSVVQPWLNFILIPVSLILTRVGFRRRSPSIVLWGLRCANCIATLSATAGVIIVIGNIKGGVTQVVMEDLYKWQGWFIVYYIAFIALHARVQWLIRKKQRQV